ncbi:uncharacterized protein EV422DRAFT_577156 [Fimicolochytrium jonesii]|uniref:uncharacterized protein n=1 Tax=Fimicolochytrium jonesii TaxID=1396493 RepID=UPI0022FEBA5B|nr:uncharacterized protein EV422DRAFT_577156 [Fimicolochytrium jonesii]KAI8823682.1 hypothetical protein EV422DRAFT_577156 [Fimicolochytrium jonesii]
MAHRPLTPAVRLAPHIETARVGSYEKSDEDGKIWFKLQIIPANVTSSRWAATSAKQASPFHRSPLDIPLSPLSPPGTPGSTLGRVLARPPPYVVRRRYEHFVEFHNAFMALVKKNPEQLAPGQALPRLPKSKIFVTRAVCEERVVRLDQYVRELFTLSPWVTRNILLAEFFGEWPMDASSDGPAVVEIKEPELEKTDSYFPKRSLSRKSSNKSDRNKHKSNSTTDNEDVALDEDWLKPIEVKRQSRLLTDFMSGRSAPASMHMRTPSRGRTDAIPEDGETPVGPLRRRPSLPQNHLNLNDISIPSSKLSVILPAGIPSLPRTPSIPVRRDSHKWASGSKPSLPIRVGTLERTIVALSATILTQNSPSDEELYKLKSAPLLSTEKEDQQLQSPISSDGPGSGRSTPARSPSQRKRSSPFRDLAESKPSLTRKSTEERRAIFSLRSSGSSDPKSPAPDSPGHSSTSSPRSSTSSSSPSRLEPPMRRALGPREMPSPPADFVHPNVKEAMAATKESLKSRSSQDSTRSGKISRKSSPLSFFKRNKSTPDLEIMTHDTEEVPEMPLRSRLTVSKDASPTTTTFDIGPLKRSKSKERLSPRPLLDYFGSTTLQRANTAPTANVTVDTAAANLAVSNAEEESDTVDALNKDTSAVPASPETMSAKSLLKKASGELGLHRVPSLLSRTRTQIGKRGKPIAPFDPNDPSIPPWNRPLATAAGADGGLKRTDSFVKNGIIYTDTTAATPPVAPAAGPAPFSAPPRSNSPLRSSSPMRNAAGKEVRYTQPPNLMRARTMNAKLDVRRSPSPFTSMSRGPRSAGPLENTLARSFSMRHRNASQDDSLKQPGPGRFSTRPGMPHSASSSALTTLNTPSSPRSSSPFGNKSNKAVALRRSHTITSTPDSVLKHFVHVKAQHDGVTILLKVSRTTSLKVVCNRLQDKFFGEGKGETERKILGLTYRDEEGSTIDVMDEEDWAVVCLIADGKIVVGIKLEQGADVATPDR